VYFGLFAMSGNSPCMVVSIVNLREAFLQFTDPKLEQKYRCTVYIVGQFKHH
jgi:hypothetical protein